jgi:large exoprotein involved in heme utilization and adhesion
MFARLMVLALCLPFLIIDCSDSGSVTINTNKLNIADSALVSVRNDGSGNAGVININADTIHISNSGGITATTAAGQGGDIDITSKFVRLNNGIISATAGQQGTNGDGGNININTNILVLTDNSSITANAFKGRGGNILINARGLFLPLNSKIIASSQFGLDGEVQVNGFYLDSSGIKLPPKVLTETPKITSVCQGQSDLVGSEFIITGVDRLPLSPNDVPRIKPTWQDNFISSETIDNSEQPKLPEKSTEIVEAQGWVQDSYGNVILTAEANSVTPYVEPSANLCSEETKVSNNPLINNLDR